MGNIGYVNAESAPVQTPVEATAMLSRDHELEPWSNVQFRRFMGSVATAQLVEKPATTNQGTLLEGLKDIQQGAEADPEKHAASNARLDINIGSAVSEILYKKGHIRQIAMQWAEDGDLVQHNQSLTQVQYNSFVFRANQHSILQGMGETEALNSYRIKSYARAGVLKDNWYVVPSLIPRGVPEEDLGEKGAGYFLRTMSYANQGTTEQDGEIIMQSTFMAGVDEKYEDESFETRMENRHDLAAIQLVCKQLGIEPPQTEQEALHGFLIHKSQMPDGMVDFMRMCDLATDRIKGQIMPRPIEDYHKIAQQSARREQQLVPVSAAIKQSLLAQVDQFNDPNDVIVALWEEARVQAAWATFENPEIDINVGGEKAAKTIAHARYLNTIGQRQAALQVMKRGVAEFIAVGCGGGASAKQTAKNDAAGLSWKDNPEKFNREDESSQNNTDDGELPQSQWKWTWGVCRNDSCSTRSKEEYNGGQAWVGPCQACMYCQPLYNKGYDPGRFAPNRRKPKAKVNMQDFMRDIGLYLLVASEKTELAQA